MSFTQRLEGFERGFSISVRQMPEAQRRIVKAFCSCYRAVEWPWRTHGSNVTWITESFRKKPPFSSRSMTGNRSHVQSLGKVGAQLRKPFRQQCKPQEMNSGFEMQGFKMSKSDWNLISKICVSQSDVCVCVHRGASMTMRPKTRMGFATFYV